MLQKRKVIIDTDIGDDIDDALALYAAMRQNFDIIGITTVFQNTADRARQVKKLLREYGNGYESVPVYAGYGIPLGAEEQEWGHIPHYTPDLEEDIYAPDSTDPEAAVDFIIDSCHRYEKELTVIAIGPFTNVARVIEKDSAALDLAEKVLIMGGAYHRQYADWNVMCDVTAADRMFRSLHHLECIGADVTHLTLAQDRLYENLFNYQGEERGHLYLTLLCRLWTREKSRNDLYLHDPLVIYHLANEELCTVKPSAVVVITDGYARGLTLNVDAYSKKYLNREAYAGFDDTRKVLVASAVDLESFNDLIFKDFNV